MSDHREPTITRADSPPDRHAPKPGLLPGQQAGHQPRLRYTIGTLVNDRGQYSQMQASFEAGGFLRDHCEFLSIDTTKLAAPCAFSGLNQLLNDAHGEIVILCHQDVRLLEDGREKLDAVLDDLTARDNNWAVAGNAGGVRPGRLAIRISDPHGEDQQPVALPSRVASLDENFLIIRRSARVSFSNDLTGFHLYGADICLVADMLGYSSYVIDFHLRHLSGGAKSVEFTALETAFRAKWSNALRSRWIQTTCSLLFVSGNRRRPALGRMAETVLGKLSKRFPGASGWTEQRKIQRTHAKRASDATSS